MKYKLNAIFTIFTRLKTKNSVFINNLHASTIRFYKATSNKATYDKNVNPLNKNVPDRITSLLLFTIS